MLKFAIIARLSLLILTDTPVEDETELVVLVEAGSFFLASTGPDVPRTNVKTNKNIAIFLLMYVILKLYMTKVWIAILALAVILGGGITFLIIKNSQQSSETATQLTQNIDQSVEEEITTKSYKDEAGFSFNYPDTLTVKDITPNDDSYYSLVDISKGGKSAKITVQDGTYKISENAKLVGSTTMAGLPAKQYSYQGNLVTFANKDGIMYVVESLDDNDFWTKTHNIIVDSFSLGSDTKSTSPSGNSGSVIEEEEVIVE